MYKRIEKFKTWLSEELKDKEKLSEEEAKNIIEKKYVVYGKKENERKQSKHISPDAIKLMQGEEVVLEVEDKEGNKQNIKLEIPEGKLKEMILKPKKLPQEANTILAEQTKRLPSKDPTKEIED